MAFDSANLHFPKTHMPEGKSACDKKKVENEVVHLLKESSLEKAMRKTQSQAE